MAVAAYGVRDLEEFAARLAELRATLAPPSLSAEFVAYTDGACFGNPSGPGGWAAAVFAYGTTDFWHLFGHLTSTSNNRAEALGVLAAMEWVPAGSRLALHSDSELTVRILQGRYKVKANTDVWQVIMRTREEKHLDLTYEWVRGHAGDPLNELADRLSKLGALNGNIEDLGKLETREPPKAPRELAGLVPRGEWEREFLTSVTTQLTRGRQLTPKQQAIIERIRARSGE